MLKQKRVYELYNTRFDDFDPSCHLTGAVRILTDFFAVSKPYSTLSVLWEDSLPCTKGQLTRCNLYHTVLLYSYAETKESLLIIDLEWGYIQRVPRFDDLDPSCHWGGTARILAGFLAWSNKWFYSKSHKSCILAVKLSLSFPRRGEGIFSTTLEVSAGNSKKERIQETLAFDDFSWKYIRICLNAKIWVPCRPLHVLKGDTFLNNALAKIGP